MGNALNEIKKFFGIQEELKMNNELLRIHDENNGNTTVYGVTHFLFNIKAQN